MTSRLDRLFVLLDTGSSPVIRKAAALQLGEVQKFHPHELHNLLAKVHVYLHSTQWETRIAAGQAVEAIIKNVPIWDPPGTGIKKEDDDQETFFLSMSGRMKFVKFDINKVLRNGSCLLASEGKEFETGDDNSILDSKERLAKQRHLLNKRLGLDMAEKMGLDTSDICCNEDLLTFKPEKPNKAQLEEINQKAVAEIVKAEMAQLAPGLSSREINKAKRKAKLIAKQRSKDNQDVTNVEEPDLKRRRTSSVILERPSKNETKTVDSELSLISGSEEMIDWPFETFCDKLSQDLFSPLWEVRHGSATALREIVRIHGEGAGKSIDSPNDQLEILNQLWLEDLALRLICVLALDRFGDFLADQVVAPVRETCAQTLAAVLSIMNKDNVRGVCQVLLQLIEQKEWEARHGGLLGLKYLLAIRKEMIGELLALVYNPIFKGLQDQVDDVCAVAASALVPVVTDIVLQLSNKITELVSTLWDLLLEQDDLTTSTNSIMALLASLLSFPRTMIHYSPNTPLNELIPRLWPFLGHNSSSVRRGALETLKTLALTNNQQEDWLVPILPDALRHIYQRCILEHVPYILDLISEVWEQLIRIVSLNHLLTASCPHLSMWFCLLMQPSNIPFASEMLIEAKHKVKEKNVKMRQSVLVETHKEQSYIGGSETVNGPPIEREHCVIKTRCQAAKLLGVLSTLIVQPIPDVNVVGSDLPCESYTNLLLFYLNTKSALQRFGVALTIVEWAKHDNTALQGLQTVQNKLLDSLNECTYYDEITLGFTRMQQECRDFIGLLKEHELSIENILPLGSVITFEQAQNLVSSTFESLVLNCKPKPKVLENMEEKRKILSLTINQTNEQQVKWNVMVQATLASSIVASGNLPEKLNPIIKPLMEAIKKEESEVLQGKAADSISHLLELCVDRAVCPNSKIIKNLCTLLTGDSSFTPRVSNCVNQSELVGNSRSTTPIIATSNYMGILTLTSMQKNAERKMISRRANSVSRGRPPTTDVSIEENLVDDETQKQVELQRRGAEFALMEITRHAGVNLPIKITKLWEAMLEPLTEQMDSNLDVDKFVENDIKAQELVNCLQVLETVVPFVDSNLHSQIIDRLPHLCMCTEHPYTAVRHMGARCLGVLSKVCTLKTMTVILDGILPSLGAMENDKKRQGAIEVIAHCIERLSLDLVPFIVLLVVPVLGRMSDPNQPVRLTATQCFASLVRLMPLEIGVQDPPSLPHHLIEKKQQERLFLEQLVDIKKVENYHIPIKIDAELRGYQQDGVNWLAFLNRYKLHGILCDDMGLGKTLQSICILAGDHFYRDREYKKTKSAECKPLPSLVVCPPTLTGHWVYEIKKFVSNKFLNPLHYTGPPAERQRLRSKAKRFNMIIASYDIVRNDIDFFSSIRWNYCILDEGHTIKNGKTKLSRAIKQLIANHRLILSGTPIQNNVLELWSLFDFLMPGFLGTEKQFIAQYSKPILLSRDAKSSSKEQEAGALAMEALHRQVLPFLLRRLKEDVLKDLPPKIIQDYYCELSSLQEKLYEDFSKSRARKNVDDVVSHGDNQNKSETTHVFQALQYLRKVCNHPKLVLNLSHPEYEKITKNMSEQKTSLSDIRHAAKLPALKQLLLDCGIGVEFASDAGSPVVNQHRALIFCQLKSMLDVLEEDLFKIHLPTVSYLRLDGSILAANRYSVVHRFNNDPSIDVLLLTTQVGGLGLNLTGADTVIFVEHDWNPMVDLQAMDRAHRIGQKKVVNVYRLITKGTLEEKIMGLQKFKMTIANTVISQENSSLMSMGTEQLLDLFSLDEGKDDSASKSASTSDSKSKGISNLLESLPELWDEKHYEIEYDLTKFLQTLKN